MKIYWNGNSKNIIGTKVRQLRKAQSLTQRALAAKLQLEGFDTTELTVLRIENGTRFVPDYEVKAISKALGVTYAELLDSSKGGRD